MEVGYKAFNGIGIAFIFICKTRFVNFVDGIQKLVLKNRVVL